MLDAGRLTPVQPSRPLADEYLQIARRRLEAAAAIETIDPSGGFVLAYDAARLAIAAILINQGLRPRGEGAHAVLLEVVLAQLEPPHQAEFREFSWMRRLRNETQYPSAEYPTASANDLVQALPVAETIVDRAAALLPHMPPF